MKNITTSTNKNCCCYCCYVASVVSDSSGPHRWQPTRLPCPWDSPGQNTGVGCHFLLQCVKVKSESEVAQSCPTLSNPMDCGPPGSSIHGIFQARELEWGAIVFSKIKTTGGQNGWQWSGELGGWRGTIFKSKLLTNTLNITKIWENTIFIN